MNANQREVHEAVRKSNLAYLRDCESKPFQLTQDVKADTCGSEINGEFVRCLSGRRELRAGTNGYLYVNHHHYYSEYKWIGDEQYPADGAKIYRSKSYYTFCTLVEIAGRKVLAHSFKTVEHNPPKLIGTV